jgi:hypothetical protein
MRFMLPVFAALCLCPYLSAADDTTRVAASIIRERASALQATQPLIAEQLQQLALMVQNGHTSLSDAALIMQISFAGMNGSAPVAKMPSGPVMTTQQVTAVLDGETVTLAKNTTKSDDVSTPTPTSTTPTAAIPVVSSVVTASRVGDNKTLLVMIGAGDDQQIKIGQRFIVKRGEQPLAVVSATQIKAAMSICIAIAGTFDDSTEIKPGDAVVSE